MHRDEEKREGWSQNEKEDRDVEELKTKKRRER